MWTPCTEIILVQKIDYQWYTFIRNYENKYSLPPANEVAGS